MSVLAEQQQALLAALWSPRAPDAAPGLRVYRSNARALAVRALQGAYPVVAQLLGEENFAALAQSLWLAEPPRRGDLAHWGAELPAHVASLVELAAEEPYLADVARLEWALHAVASAPDAELDAASFALLTQRDPAEVTLLLTPGTQRVASAWPVASIVLAHLEGEPTLQQAGERLRDRIAECAVVWREGPKPRLRSAPADEFHFLAALQAGASLALAWAAAPALDFNEWLAPAVQCGLVTGARPLFD